MQVKFPFNTECDKIIENYCGACLTRFYEYKGKRNESKRINRVLLSFRTILNSNIYLAIYI